MSSGPLPLKISLTDGRLVGFDPAADGESDRSVVIVVDAPPPAAAGAANAHAASAAQEYARLNAGPRRFQVVPSSYTGRLGTPYGRNDPCPCGGGKKWKRCHGSRS
jgi:hypothetical protein